MTSRALGRTIACAAALALTLAAAPGSATPLLPGTTHDLENHSGEDHTGEVIPNLTVTNSNLQGIIFRNASLTDSFLTDSDLTGGASLRNGTFTNTAFDRSDLSGANLRGADFTSASFDMSVLDGADMRAGVFTGADMSSADLSNTDLRGTDLSGTVLIGAILIGINTNGGTSFAGASYDLTTQFDVGFDPVAEGMVLVREAGTGTLIALALVAALATRTRPGGSPARAPGGESGEDCERTSLQQG